MLLSVLAAATLTACRDLAVDGASTFRCEGEAFALENIDAPAPPGTDKCRRQRWQPAWCDAKAAKSAQQALASFLGRGAITLRRIGHDATGRTLARVTVNGRDAGAYLIAKGLARPWK